MLSAKTQPPANLPSTRSVQLLTRRMFLHVIARSGATGQSASPAVAQSRKQHLRRIRESATNLPKQQPTCQASLRGKRIATPVCTLVRNDMLKTVTRLRVQERLARKVRKNMPGVSRGRALGCGDISPTVIARSRATWQSASPAVAQSRKQRLRRIRESVTNLPKQQPTCQASLRGKRIATPVCALARNDMLKAGTCARAKDTGLQ